MQKIPTLFVRDHDDMSRLTRTVNPACQWVIDGEGRATRKYDGTCVMFDGNAWWSRREVKRGRPVPEGFRLVQDDPATGKSFGWEPIGQSSFTRIHADVLTQRTRFHDHFQRGQTYELVGPRINGNPEKYADHELVPHGADDLIDVPRDYDGLGSYLETRPYEGVVWHHDDGRMAKIKRRDFRNGS